MSARVLAACSFEPAPEQSVASGCLASGGIAAEIRFRQSLWREYWIEAINAGFSTAQATQYANALSQEMGLVAGVSEMALLGRGWFYQSRAEVVRRTITSGLIARAHWGNGRATGRIAAACASRFARWLRPWNAGAKG